MINENCPCTRKCERHGNCGECRAYHENRKHLPVCEREATNSADKERKREKRKELRNEHRNRHQT